VADNAAVAMSLIENIQRENLNSMEEAIALQRLQEEFSLTQAEVAEAVGKSRSTVTNLLRLIQLTDEVKLMLENGDLEMGHGRAMLALRPEQQIQAARMVESKSLSVRQTEALVRKFLEDVKDKPVEGVKINKDVERLEEDLSEKIGSSVSIVYTSKGKGKLTIKYNSLDELDGILKHIH
jgi:ParB family chromosome partitioning protein